MSNVFNSVKGLKPKMRSFSAHSYRNDLTHPAGVIVPVYQQHVTAKTRVLLRTHALVRTMPLVAPIMDNVDYFVHFWQIPYRLLENDKFTEFISGEIDEDSVYTGNNWFFSPYDLVNAMKSVIQINTPRFNCIFGDCGLFDTLGYDKSLFGWNEDDQEFDADNASKKRINWRPLIAYLMLMLHWYMNENVPYFADFVDYTKKILKNGVCTYDDDDVVTISYDFLSILEDIVQLNLYGNSESRYCSFMPHAWAKDYFTSALPNVQLGEAAGLPLDITGTASIAPFNALLSGNGESSYPGGPDTIHLGLLNEGEETFTDGEKTPLSAQVIIGTSDTYLDTAFRAGQSINLPVGDIHDVKISGINQQGEAVPISSTIRMDNAGVITINELRFANALQVFKERQLRFGRRRLEYYKGFFDVTPEDLRLQVPRFLGGGRLPINISDVEQTSSSTESSAQGNLAGKGTAVAGGFAGFNTFCSEETIILGLAFVMPKNTYANGLSRFMLKTDDRYDYFNPSFQHLGEQAITKIELFAGASSPDDEFGYTPRFNEYRFHNNEVHGSFKSTLAYWNLARIFKQAPALNADFIYMKPAYFDRIFNYGGKDPILASLHFSVRLLQPVSKYGTPMLLA